MKKLSTLALATTLGIFSFGAHAAENFAGFTWGKSTVNTDRSSSLKLRQQNLIGSYDMFVPLGDTTRLFGGASAGLTKLENESKGYTRDSDIGYLVGLQAGILQKLGDNTSVEAGYRYLRSNAGTEVSERGVGKLGSIDVHSSKQAYLGLNYHF